MLREGASAKAGRAGMPVLATTGQKEFQLLVVFSSSLSSGKRLIFPKNTIMTRQDQNLSLSHSNDRLQDLRGNVGL